MKGTEVYLAAFMNGYRKRFIIPVYQRNYDWKLENCKRLYDDLVKVIKKDRRSHFFGSIVYMEGSGQEEYHIIDGQQRLTTVSLLLLAMYNLLNEGVIEAEESNLTQKIYEEYLVDKYEEKEKKIKLKPIKNDNQAYQKLFKEQEDHLPQSNVTINYNYFYERIQKQEITIDELFRAIESLEIISIMLEKDDNAQMIFESLNSTGLALSEGDKIRNYVLMGLPTEQQYEYYEKYWHKIELCTDYDVSAFIRDYLSVKTQIISAQKRVYLSFKEYVEENELETEGLLQDILKYAKWYKLLLKGGTNSRIVNGCIDRLNRLETTVIRPFFLNVFQIYHDDVLNIKEMEEIFSIAENYISRRMICDIPTNSLNKTFLLLHKEILRYDSTSDDYVEKFKYALTSKRESTRFPNDNELAAHFPIRQVYLMNRKNRLYIFERLENQGTIEDKDVYRHIEEGDYSIEHVMPQNLTPNWKEMLGENYEEIHETWLHRIGNLTLTAYNSRYSNSPFMDKKTMKNGFNESGIRLNTYFYDVDEWRAKEIQERSKHLTEKALEIWSYPETSYKPPVKQLETYSLADDMSMQGREIAKFTFMNVEQSVSSWTDMYERILLMLHQEDKSVLTNIAYSLTESNLTPWFKNNSTELRDSIEIEEGIYAEKNCDTNTKLSILRKVFDLFDVSQDDLEFALKDRDEEVIKSKSDRKILLNEYWEYALPKIKESLTILDSASEATPNVNNVTFATGHSNVYLLCIANMNRSRVILTITSRDNAWNHRLFDSLYSKKEEIEEKLGTPLVWDRNEKYYNSKIMVVNRNVKLRNKNDWEEMKEFHCKWARKFVDLLLPYVDEIL